MITEIQKKNQMIQGAFLLSLALLCGYWILKSPLSRDGVLYLHLTAGKEIVKFFNGFTPFPSWENYSYTAFGTPTELHSWIGQALLSVVYGLGKDTALRILHWVICLSIIGFSVYRCAKGAFDKNWMIVVCATSTFLLHRQNGDIKPALFGELLFVCIQFGVLDTLRDFCPLRLALLTLLTPLWVNLHGTSLLILPIVLIYGIYSLWREENGVGLYLIAVFATIFFQPEGYGVFAKAFNLALAARSAGAFEWGVRRDLESVLRSMQRAADHQKTLAAHGALISDQRLQLSAPKWKDINSLEGRLLSHGEGETGNRFLLLEGTDGRVYHVGYTPEMDEARERGHLRTSSFLVITKTIDDDRKRRIEIVSLGDAEDLLEDKGHFQSRAQRLIRRGVVALEGEQWNGWLGQYQDNLRKAVMDAFETPARSRQRVHGPER